ncbi:transcriptional regulator [Robinsoniella peoriensis]|uniref:transcriptional regulator n=1 Tax=Robinsoniella peoriensis TaxID=180332 RepID=UPI00375155CE
MFFRRIDDFRIDHDETQEQIAELLMCQREVYRRYEKGIRESVDYLLGVSDKKRPFGE